MVTAGDSSVVSEEPRKGDLILRDRLGEQPLVRASNADVMHGLDAASHHNGRGFALDITVRAHRMATLVLRGNSHCGSEDQGLRMPKKPLPEYPPRKV